MKKYILLLLILTVVSCGFFSEKSKWDDQQKIPWLNAGLWQRSTANGTVYEKWQQLDDSTYSGTAYRLSESDSLVTEKLQLEFRKGQVYYVAAVPHNASPVAFRMTTSSDSLVIFENTEHDFPQMISYHQKSADSLMVWLSGPGDNEDDIRKMTFVFAKSKD